VLSIVFNYFIGLDIESHRERPAKMKAVLAFGIAFNLISLGFFKYSGFVVDSFNSFFSFDIQFTAPGLPVGISFYTFQIISYIVDVYRGTVAQKKIIPFAAYVTMFPQLIAGPIVQYGDIEKQLNERYISREKLAAGIIIFIKGMGKKVLFANTVGAFYTQISELEITSVSAATAWIGIICYTLQIYFDFSGYSDMAIGLGKMLGFDFIQNFNFPYTAKSITDFWRRWHISLSNWFRDYVYIPLGGNRVGPLRHILNILVVWALTGMWHGAAWNFIVWGLYFALFLLVEKLWLLPKLEKSRVLSHIYVVFFVLISFVIFNAAGMGEAAAYIKAMFGFGGIPAVSAEAIYYLRSYAVLLLLAAVWATPLLAKK
jgi:alginate O-acetyltransferase complex protein AlgI